MPEILEFSLGGNSYAIDIGYTREIVDPLPVTSIPRTPEYIAGMTNIRGEITTLIWLARIIGQSSPVAPKSQKFIILVPETARGDKIGLIVDEVHSVSPVPDSDIEYAEDDTTKSQKTFIKGIIRMDEDRTGTGQKERARKLVLYLDIDKVLSHIFELARR